MSKTFREVIRDIEDGEVWIVENKNIKIYSEGRGIMFDLGKEIKLERLYFPDTITFELQRLKYTFTEAFVEYEQGAEIESVKTGTKYKKENGLDCWFSKVSLEWSENNDDFSIGEIRDKWYINK